MADVNELRDIHPEFDVSFVRTLLEFENQKLNNVVKGWQTIEYYKTFVIK